MKDIYNDNTYLIQNPTWHEEDASFKVNKIVKLLNRNSISFKTVSEIGCGSGEILVQMESHFPEVTKFYGFDISKDAIEIAKKKETNRIKFEIKNLSDENEIGFYDFLERIC
jgi:tRNA G46 methylase TrmB